MKCSALLVFFLLATPLLAQQSGAGKAQISVPGVKGMMEIDVGPTTWTSQVRPDGKETQLRAMVRPDRILISAFLQQVKFPASAEACREKWWPMTAKSVHMKREDLRNSEKDGIATVEYSVSKFQGIPIHMKSVHAYLGVNDLCAEVHLSMNEAEPNVEKLFNDVLATFRLLPDASAPVQNQPASDTVKLFAEGSKFYQTHNYSSAADRYQKALDLEKRDRTLSKSLFRVLVDNLGMSYGITGKLSQARETFEYGITQDPEYPMFHYLLACTYAEQGKMEESLEQLALAYKFKASMIPGESLPDPLKDASFRNFISNKKFVDAIHSMQAQ